MSQPFTASPSDECSVLPDIPIPNIPIPRISSLVSVPHATILPCRSNTLADTSTEIIPPANPSTAVVAEGDTSSPCQAGSSTGSASLLSSTLPLSIRNFEQHSLTPHTNSPSNSLIATTRDQCSVSLSPALEPHRWVPAVTLPAATTRPRQRENSDSSSAPHVDGPIDASTSGPPHPPSTSDLLTDPEYSKPIHFSAHVPSGPPGFHCLKLPRSYCQLDPVNAGFPAAFDFVDKSIARGGGVLIHLQCDDEHLPSFIRRLFDHGRSPRSGGASSSTSSNLRSIVAAEEEWGHRRSPPDNNASNPDAEDEPDTTEAPHEARSLDKAVGDCILSRKSSSSLVPCGLGVGTAWRSSCSDRTRTESVVSKLASGSTLSENLVEGEQGELLSSDNLESDATSSDSQCDGESMNGLPPTPHPVGPPVQPKPSSGGAISTHPFDTPLLQGVCLVMKNRRCPPPLSILPVTPPSPTKPRVMKSDPLQTTQTHPEPRILAPTSLPSHRIPTKHTIPSQLLPAPSQTFVFPPSPPSPDALPSAAPSVMILIPSANAPRFPRTKTAHPSRRGFPGHISSILASATPTAALSLVDARGWVGLK